MLLLPVARPAYGQGEPVTAFVNATVVDVERGAVSRNQTIVTRAGRIAAVGSSTSTRVPRGATRIDLRGQYVIPGLWDAHVHVSGNADIPAIVEYFGSLFLRNGVTGIRDAGGYATRLNALDSIGRARPGAMPRLIHAGDKVGPLAGQPWTMAATRSAIDARLKAGASFIKLSLNYPTELFAPTLAACAAVRLQCVSHVPAGDTGLWLAAPGRGSFEHLFNIAEHVSSRPASELFADTREYEQPTIRQRVLYKLRLRRRPMDPREMRLALRDTSRDEAFFSRLAASGTWITPTLALHHHLTRVVDLPAAAVDTTLTPSAGQQEPARSSQALRTSKALWDLWTGLVRAMHAAGVPMLAGTDFSRAHVPGAVLHAELVLLQDAGVPAPDVLRMATVNVARYLGALDSLGSVAPGKVADLVVVRRNPLDDIRHVSDISLVMTRGTLLRGATLDSLTRVARSALVRLRAGSRNQ